jgi:fumarate hydratase class II
VETTTELPITTRTERDSLGEREVAADALFGIHTVRSRENFDVARTGLDIEIIYGIVKLKWACVLANRDLNMLPPEKVQAIAAACEEVLTGAHDDSLYIDVFQAGSGTSTNMNINEVVGNLACIKLGGKPGDRHLVHPNDDVNKGQSTNNIFPSGIKVAAVERAHLVQEAMRELQAGLHNKEHEFADVIKSGRTHLQDAVPITLGMELGAYAHALEKANLRIEDARQHCMALGVGGNAVGTGINTTVDFRRRIVDHLNSITGEKYHVAANGIEITQFLTDIGEMGGALKFLALDLLKICNDLRLLSSGPNTGIGEIQLPAVEPGSSIMPGKVNPSICEAANMACIQVLGYEAAIAMACGMGQLELNTHMPLVGHNVMRSIRLLRRTCFMVARKCVSGIVANREVCKENFERSAGLATVLNPTLGYDAVAELVKESLRTGKNLRQLVLEKDIMDEEHLDFLLSKSIGPTL